MFFETQSISTNFDNCTPFRCTLYIHVAYMDCRREQGRDLLHHPK